MRFNILFFETLLNGIHVQIFSKSLRHKTTNPNPPTICTFTYHKLYKLCFDSVYAALSHINMFTTFLPVVTFPCVHHMSRVHLNACVLVLITWHVFTTCHVFTSIHVSSCLSLVTCSPNITCPR